MAATIQTIEKPTRARALDTSGNNNHGQIYSGRALEFDGVTDYLDPPNGAQQSSINSTSFFKGTTSDSNFVTNANGNVVPVQATTCIWLYTKSLSVKQHIQESGGGEWGIHLHTSGKVQVGYLNDNYGVDSSNDSPRYITSSELEANTWYRLVVVWNMQEGTSSEVFKVYINGVLDTGGTDGEMGSTGNRAYKRISPDYSLRVGCYGNGVREFFNGYLSDFQIWDRGFTQDDVLYDYNNPEQLVINRGGTSLTNSNLRLWYPMNDGHRGQQSYVLDASNTGLGDELWDSDKLLGGGASSWVGYGGNEITDIGDAIAITHVGSTAGAYLQLRDSNTLSSDLTVGVTYKLQFDAKMYSGAAVNLIYSRTGTGTIYPDDGVVNQTSYQTFTQYIKAGHKTNVLIRFGNMASGETVHATNFSLKPVNQKNHATTVFTGDDLWDGADDSVANWVAVGNSSEVASAGCIKLTAGEGDSASAIELRDSSDLTADLVAGRNYQVSYDSAGDIVGSSQQLKAYTTGYINASSTTTVTNVVGNGNMNSSGTWTEVPGSGAINRTGSVKHNGTHSYYIQTVGGNTSYIYQTITGLSANTKYLFTYWSKNANASASGDIRAKVYDNDNSGDLALNGSTGYLASGNETTDWVQFAGQFTTGSGNTSINLIFFSPTGNYLAYVDDVVISAFETNTIDFTASHATNNIIKHMQGHGTEMIAAVNDRNSIFDEAGQWIAQDPSGSNVTVNVTGGALVVATTSDNEAEGAKLPVANFTALELGRSYMIQSTLSSNTGTPTVKFRLGDSNITTKAIDTTPTAYYTVVTPTNTTGELKIYTQVGSAYTLTIDNVYIYPIENLWVDDISLKEVGTATGWTDADQQLDIPQTALQSYNQLAWFDGHYGNRATLDSTINTTTNSWSLSFWLFNIDNGNYYDFIIGSTSNRNLAVDNNTDRKLYYRASNGSYYALSDEVIPQGEWVHIIVTATADTSMTAYVNGEAQTTNSSMSDTELILDRFMAGYNTSSYESIGSINEISYYNDVLTVGEAKDLYNDGKAKSALEASGSGNLVGYWRNNGLAEWKDLKGSNDVNTTGNEEAILITAGADATRDSQGFLMNRQRLTNSLNLDGELSATADTGSYINVGDLDSLDFGTNAFSVSFWAKIYADETQTLVGKQDSSSGWYIYTDHTNNRISFYHRKDNKYTHGSTDINDSSWHHVCFTRNGATGKIYIDGVNDTASTQDISADVDSAGDKLEIGRRNLGTTDDRYLNGKIDDLCIYSKELSAAEVTRNYNAGKRSHR